MQRGMPPPDWIVYALFDTIVDAHIPMVDAMVAETTTLDNLSLTLLLEDQGDFFSRIRLANARLGRLRDTLLVKQEVLSQLTTRSSTEFISETTKLYLRDVLDQVKQLLQKTEVSSNTLNCIPTTYLARLSVESAIQANQLAKVMKQLAAITLLMLPATLITGIFGMNVSYPGMVGDEESYGPFFGICGGLLIMIAVFAFIMRRKKWL
jgi:Mg2+ and Co2+ transporter CorA